MQPSLSSPVVGALAMVGCAFLWSTAGLFIKLLDWNPYWIAGLRSLIAGVCLAVVSGLGNRGWRIRWSWPLVGAAVANAVCMLLFVLANKMTTSANAILIQYWAPVATALLSVVVLKEKLHPEQIVALVVTLGGLVLLFADKLGAGALGGNLAALGSGLAFSLVFLFTRMQKDSHPLPSLMLSHLLLAAVALGVAWFQPAPVLTVESVSSIVFLGVAQVGLAALLFAVAIRRISALTANLLSVIEPVLNPLWVFLILGEVPSARTVVGGLFVVASVTVAGVVGARRG